MNRFLRIAFWAAAFFAFAMAVLPARADPLPASDKIQHMAAFFIVTSLGCAAYPRLSRSALLLAMIAFGGAIELVQMVPMLHRDAEWADWLADIVAVIAALAVAPFIERARTRD